MLLLPLIVIFVVAIIVIINMTVVVKSVDTIFIAVTLKIQSKKSNKSVRNKQNLTLPTRGGRCSSLTSEALATLAGEAIEQVDAGASVLAGAGRAVVPVLVTVLADPSGLAVAAVATNTRTVQFGWRKINPYIQSKAGRSVSVSNFKAWVRVVPVDVVPAGAVHARAAAALVHLRVAVGRLEALGTLAVEAVLFIHTRASVPAGAGRTLIDLHVTLGACQRKEMNVRYGKGIFFFWMDFFVFIGQWSYQ